MLSLALTIIPLNHSAMSTEKKTRNQVQQAVSAYKKMLDTHCANGDNIHEVATEYHISRNALQQGFRRKSGMGIREYKLRLRMERSRELLDSGKEVKEIAATLRYSEPRAFTTAFKRFYGVTPSEFKPPKPKA
jgi:AraC-like DNA-binding protein